MPWQRLSFYRFTERDTRSFRVWTTPELPGLIFLNAQHQGFWTSDYRARITRGWLVGLHRDWYEEDEQSLAVRTVRALTDQVFPTRAAARQAAAAVWALERA